MRRLAWTLVERGQRGSVRVILAWIGLSSRDNPMVARRKGIGVWMALGIFPLNGFPGGRGNRSG